MHAPHTLSHCNVFIYFRLLCCVFCSFWAQVKQNNSWYIWQIADFVSGNLLILTGNKLPVNVNLQIQRHLRIIGGWIRLVVSTYSEIWSLKSPPPPPPPPPPKKKKKMIYNVWLLVLISHVRHFPTSLHISDFHNYHQLSMHKWSRHMSLNQQETCRFFTDIPHDVQ